VFGWATSGFVEETDMHRICLESEPPRAIIEVDGDLGLVAAYDLRRVVEAALGQECRSISFDLSRVVVVDGSALSALLGCFEFAEAKGAEIKLVALSSPASRVSFLVDRAGCCDRASA
jgi:anti-anti-sigma factor